MPVQLLRGDIRSIKCDAVVMAARPAFREDGGAPGGRRPGTARLSRHLGSHSRYVIRTVLPVWRGGAEGEAAVLERCWQACLELAEIRGCETAAFPLLSPKDFPRETALEIALRALDAFLTDHEMTVLLVIPQGERLSPGGAFAQALDQYIHRRMDREPRMESFAEAAPNIPDDLAEPRLDSPGKRPACGCAQSRPSQPPAEDDACMPCCESDSGFSPELGDRLRHLDESFQQMLLRLIDQRGMTDAECYKKANVDRKLFSKIRSNVRYRPSKRTALAFAVALELSMEDTEALLRKAGYALSASNVADVIVLFFLERGIYDVMRINEALFYYDQALLGA